MNTLTRLADIFLIAVALFLIGGAAYFGWSHILNYKEPEIQELRARIEALEIGCPCNSR